MSRLQAVLDKYVVFAQLLLHEFLLLKLLTGLLQVALGLASGYENLVMSSLLLDYNKEAPGVKKFEMQTACSEGRHTV